MTIAFLTCKLDLFTLTKHLFSLLTYDAKLALAVWYVEVKLCTVGLMLSHFNLKKIINSILPSKFNKSWYQTRQTKTHCLALLSYLFNKVWHLLDVKLLISIWYPQFGREATRPMTMWPDDYYFKHWAQQQGRELCIFFFI